MRGPGRSSRSAAAPRAAPSELRLPMPATETLAAGSRSPFSAPISVVLPAPDGPTMAVTAPSSKSSDTSHITAHRRPRRSTAMAVTVPWVASKPVLSSLLQSFRWRYLARKLQAAGQSSGASKNSVRAGAHSGEHRADEFVLPVRSSLKPGSPGMRAGSIRDGKLVARARTLEPDQKTYRLAVYLSASALSGYVAPAASTQPSPVRPTRGI